MMELGSTTKLVIYRYTQIYIWKIISRSYFMRHGAVLLAKDWSWHAAIAVKLWYFVVYDMYYIQICIAAIVSEFDICSRRCFNMEARHLSNYT